MVSGLFFLLSIVIVFLGIGMIAADGIFLTVLGVIVLAIGAIWGIRLLFGF